MERCSQRRSRRPGRHSFLDDAHLHVLARRGANRLDLSKGGLFEAELIERGRVAPQPLCGLARYPRRPLRSCAELIRLREDRFGGSVGLANLDPW